MALLRLRTRQRVARLTPACVLLCCCLYLRGDLQFTGNKADLDADEGFEEDGGADAPADSDIENPLEGGGDPVNPTGEDSADPASIAGLSVPAASARAPHLAARVVRCPRPRTRTKRPRVLVYPDETRFDLLLSMTSPDDDAVAQQALHKPCAYHNWPAFAGVAGNSRALARRAIPVPAV